MCKRCKRSRLKTFMKLAKTGELIAAKAYGRAARLAEKADCQNVSKTINGLSKSEIAHANLCQKVIDGINAPAPDEQTTQETAESPQDAQ